MPVANPVGSNANYFATLLGKNPRLLKSLAPRLNKYIPHKPTPKQTAFLLVNDLLEVFYGGAAAGGKSDALLMAGLQFVDYPEYSGLILRRTYSMLNMADSILDRAFEWMRPHKDVQWVAGKNRFEFPSGARLQFGYLQHEKDVYQYDGPAYHFIGFDELTQFTEWQYTFLFGRMRRRTGSMLPLRMRSASNPGGVGHFWVKDRFITQNQPKGRLFIPARLEDNPHADREAYELSLAQMDPITRTQRRYGDWNISRAGKYFKPEWFSLFAEVSPVDVVRIRYWDLAATKGGGAYTVGTRVSMDLMGHVFVEDVKRQQLGPHGVKQLVRATAQMDGKATIIVIEQEPGSSGKIVTNDFVPLLAGYQFHGDPVTGPKETRWLPFASQCEAGNVTLVRGPWNHDWIEEMCLVPEGKYKDQADSVSGAFNYLAMHPPIDFGVSFLGSKA